MWDTMLLMLGIQSRIKQKHWSHGAHSIDVERKSHEKLKCKAISTTVKENTRCNRKKRGGLCVGQGQGEQVVRVRVCTSVL